MTDQMQQQACSTGKGGPSLPVTSYDPAEVRGKHVRTSRNGRRRAIVLLAVHVVAFLHIWHWQIRGQTITPVEPSEAMYTLARGAVNAGAILFSLSILSTLIMGRWFCGWACHLVALQDLCAWMLKKIGLRPRPLRSRTLVWIPLLACLLMFGQPLLVRLVNNLGPPAWHLELEKSAFWETFPGFWIGLLTFVVCGFVMVYLLGSKGFCTFACPYGGIFGVVDRLAPGRIRVTDACKACGHCTAACTSNVLIHREVLEYGMVVDPGCMKCGDCVSVCPENALYFGFGKPALFAKPKRQPRPRKFTFSIREDVAAILAFPVILAIFTGFPVGFFPWAPSLYGVMPLLFALGLSGITVGVGVFFVRLLRATDVRFQGLTLKQEGKIRRPGFVLGTLFSAWILFLIHSTVVQYHTFRGLHAYGNVQVTRAELLAPGPRVLDRLDSTSVDTVHDAKFHLERASDLGLFPHFNVSGARAGLFLIQGDHGAAAEQLSAALESSPDNIVTRSDLAHVLALQGRHRRAVVQLRKLIRLAPDDLNHRNNLVVALEAAQDPAGAVAARQDLLQHIVRLLENNPQDAQLRTELGAQLIESGHYDRGLEELARAVKDDPEDARARYNLGASLLMIRQDVAAALPHLRKSAELQPNDLQSQFFLAQACLAAKLNEEAVIALEKCVELDPQNPQRHQALGDVLKSLGRREDAARHHQIARELTNQQVTPKKQ